jgi:hypothetical protein
MYFVLLNTVSVPFFFKEIGPVADPEEFSRGAVKVWGFGRGVPSPRGKGSGEGTKK